MKTRSKAKIQAMKELFALRTTIKALQEEEKIIRQNLMASMSQHDVMEGGGYVALLTTAKSSKLDKDLLVQEQGKDFVDEYIVESEYQKLEVKEVA